MFFIFFYFNVDSVYKVCFNIEKGEGIIMDEKGGFFFLVRKGVWDVLEKNCLFWFNCGMLVFGYGNFLLKNLISWMIFWFLWVDKCWKLLVFSGFFMWFFCLDSDWFLFDFFIVWFYLLEWYSNGFDCFWKWKFFVCRIGCEIFKRIVVMYEDWNIKNNKNKIK